MIEKKIDHFAAIGGSIAAIIAKIGAADILEFVVITAAGGFIGGVAKQVGRWTIEKLRTWWQNR